MTLPPRADWADEKARDVNVAWYREGGISIHSFIAQALRDTRNRALDEAAVVAIDNGKFAKGGYNNMAWEIAESIRALKEKKPV